MPWSISYSDQAQKDVRVAFRYYKNISEVLGKYFLSELKYAEKTVLNSPEGFQIRFFERIRGCPLKHFPFLMLYVVVEKSVNVLAVFNTNQNPELMESRLKSV
ncbi:type II toxin-antitoxin system RelE/ParE family toxin [Algoriphagus sp. H41]|uniref:Type II toxin-antitoxin system RelE/ParE family toxin n=1 Tax=Algoriphagus oliviformis TaxID=2811231 RepID=A0ABS3C912_9BACT|nr:type II toxin-antitoxin system RelE/ParE family toxin [Algoriphagus oliviformis]MBN7813315.1 type II toxin-antitoxin system RelE/ParE family toxin [Algoriphagus oliviformis]